MTDGRRFPSLQLPLDLMPVPAIGRADFLVGASNRRAIELIDRWPDWPDRPVILVGPAGSGKSHLVAAWREVSGAPVVRAEDLGRADVAALVSVLAVEDIDRGPLNEDALFHLVNVARDNRAALLLTTRSPVSALGLGLPDLVSRLRAAHEVSLAEPDDELLTQLLTKLFADRQIAVDRSMIDYILVRMERSLAAAGAVVEAIDVEALSAGRPVTRQLAGVVLERLYGRHTVPR